MAMARIVAFIATAHAQKQHYHSQEKHKSTMLKKKTPQPKQSNEEEEEHEEEEEEKEEVHDTFPHTNHANACIHPHPFQRLSTSIVHSTLSSSSVTSGSSSPQHRPYNMARRRSSIAIMNPSSLLPSAQELHPNHHTPDHAHTSVWGPDTTPKSKASAFLLSIVHGKTHSSSASKDPLTSPSRQSSVIVHQPNRRRAHRSSHHSLAKSISVARRLAVYDTDTRSETPAEAPERDHRSIGLLLSELHKKKQDITKQLHVFSEILMRLHETECEDAQNKLSQQLVDAGVLCELMTSMREFRFHVTLQTTAINILAFLIEANELYAFMMSELNLSALIQKAIGIHSSHEKLVMMGTAVVHMIQDARNQTNAKKLKAIQYEQERQRVTVFAEAVAAEMRAKQKQHQPIRSIPKPVSIKKHEKPAPTPVNKRQEEEAVDDPAVRGRTPSRSASRLRRALSIDAPQLTARYDLEFPQKKPSDSTSSLPPVLKNEPVMRPMTSPVRRLQPSGSFGSLAEPLVIAAYGGPSVFVEPSPLTQRLRGGSIHQLKTITQLKKMRRRTTMKPPATKDKDDWLWENEPVKKPVEKPTEEQNEQSKEPKEVQEEEEAPDSPSSEYSEDFDDEVPRMGRVASDTELLEIIQAQETQGTKEEKAEDTQLRNQHYAQDQASQPSSSLLPKQPWTPLEPKKKKIPKHVIMAAVDRLYHNHKYYYRKPPPEPSKPPEEEVLATKEEDEEEEKEETLRRIQTAYAKGLEHHKANDLVQAIAYYQQALAIPTSKAFASIHINLGSAFMSQRQFTDALQCFQMAEKIQPTNVKAMYNSALAYLQLGHPTKALTKLQKVLALDPTHQKAQQAMQTITKSKS